MKVIEKLILTSDDKEVKRKLKLADYLYREIETDENSEQLEELVSLIAEAVDNGKQKPNATSVRFESELMDAFYHYLLNSGKTEKSSYDYCTRLTRILKELGIPIEDFINGKASVQALIDLYSKGGAKYRENVKQHNGPSSALKQFKIFLAGIERYPCGTPKNEIFIPAEPDDGDGSFDADSCLSAPLDIYEHNHDDAYIYLHDTEGYQSFESASKHCCEIEIENRNCTIKFRKNRALCETVNKVLNDKNYADLIRLMKQYYSILNEDQTPASTAVPFGGVHSYEYKFRHKSNYSGSYKLFDCDDRVLLNSAQLRYAKVITNIINQ